MSEAWPTRSWTEGAKLRKIRTRAAEGGGWKNASTYSDQRRAGRCGKTCNGTPGGGTFWDRRQGAGKTCRGSISVLDTQEIYQTTGFSRSQQKNPTPHHVKTDRRGPCLKKSRKSRSGQSSLLILSHVV